MSILPGLWPKRLGPKLATTELLTKLLELMKQEDLVFFFRGPLLLWASESSASRHLESKEHRQKGLHCPSAQWQMGKCRQERLGEAFVDWAHEEGPAQE